MLRKHVPVPLDEKPYLVNNSDFDILTDGSFNYAMWFLVSLACFQRVQRTRELFKAYPWFAHKNVSQYGALIFFCYLKTHKHIHKMHTDPWYVITEHVAWNCGLPGTFFLHRWHTHSLVSIYYLIRMGKMLNALVSNF